MADRALPVKCGTPGCDCKGPFYVHNKCHLDAPSWPVISGDLLILRCAECGQVTDGFRVTGIAPYAEAKACLNVQ
jgi:hypothetical protein